MFYFIAAFNFSYSILLQMKPQLYTILFVHRGVKTIKTLKHNDNRKIINHKHKNWIFTANKSTCDLQHSNINKQSWYTIKYFPHLLLHVFVFQSCTFTRKISTAHHFQIPHFHR